MSTYKQERFEEILKHLSAEFLSIYSNRTSMITVTRVKATTKGDRATVFVTVLPEDKEEAAMDFLERNLSDLRAYVRDHGRLMKIPFFTIEIDRGEKARQKIDEALVK